MNYKKVQGTGKNINLNRRKNSDIQKGGGLISLSLFQMLAKKPFQPVTCTVLDVTCRIKSAQTYKDIAL